LLINANYAISYLSDENIGDLSMAKQSPGYPHIPLNKALDRAKKIFEADRTNVVDRESAAKHLGYTSVSGASDQMLAALGHYGLVSPAGKGQTRITSLGVDIFAPEDETAKKKALYIAGKLPSVFKMIDSHFDTRPSESTLKNWLIREEFIDRAIQPVMKAYFRTLDFLKQEGAIESGASSTDESANVDVPSDNGVVYGGANVGDLIQWEVDGTFKLLNPTRVRQVTDDGEWVFVDGSESGIPMQEIIVEKNSTPPPATITPPTLALATPPTPDVPPEGSFTLSSGKVKDVSFEVRVTGEVNQTVIDRIIKYLELTKGDYDE